MFMSGRGCPDCSNRPKDISKEKALKRIKIQLGSDKFKNLESCIFEKIEGLVVVDFVPTSENLCRFFGDVAIASLDGLLDDRIKLSFVEFWETPKSRCVYTVES